MSLHCNSYTSSTAIYQILCTHFSCQCGSFTVTNEFQSNRIDWIELKRIELNRIEFKQQTKWNCSISPNASNTLANGSCHWLLATKSWNLTNINNSSRTTLEWRALASWFHCHSYEYKANHNIKEYVIKRISIMTTGILLQERCQAKGGWNYISSFFLFFFSQLRRLLSCEIIFDVY